MSTVVCTLCGRRSDLYPDLPMFDLKPSILCGTCAQGLGEKAMEMHRRANAARALDRAKDRPAHASLRDLVDGMADSVRRDPDEWWTDGYRLYHANGVEIWIANGASYLKITIPTRGQFTIPWLQRRRLWRAVASWRGRPLPAFWRYNPVRFEEGHRS